MWRCERHGGHDPEAHCYPCHTENLIKAEAENERLRGDIQALLRFDQCMLCRIKLDHFDGMDIVYCSACVVTGKRKAQDYLEGE